MALHKVSHIIRKVQSTYPIEAVYAKIIGNDFLPTITEDIIIMAVGEAFEIEHFSKNCDHRLKTTAYGIIGLIGKEHAHNGVNMTEISRKVKITRAHLYNRAKEIEKEMAESPEGMTAKFLRKCQANIAKIISLKIIENPK